MRQAAKIAIGAVAGIVVTYLAAAFVISDLWFAHDVWHWHPVDRSVLLCWATLGAGGGVWFGLWSREPR